MTIQELLDRQKSKKLKVLNQGADLERKVTSVESTETPDVVSFLPEDTILITTGMTYKDDQKALCTLIEDLDKLPCAGIAIKLGRFIDVLEEQVIETADRLGFPLIQIPADMTLGDVYHELLAYLWNDQNEDLSFALNTQKKFSNLVTQGVSTKAFLNNVSMVIDKAVAIISPFGELMEASRNCSEADIKLAKILFEDYGLHEQQISQIEHFRDQKHEKGRVLIYPVKVVSRHADYLFIFDSEDLVTERQKLIIEQIIQTLGTFLHEKLRQTFAEICEKEHFLQILTGKDENITWTKEQLLTLGAHFGVEKSSAYMVVVGTIRPYGLRTFESGKFSQREERYIESYLWLNRWLSTEFGNAAILFPQYQDFRFVFLLQGGKRFAKSQMEAVHDIMQKMMQQDLAFSMGNELTEIHAVKDSYREALESYKDGSAKDDEKYIYKFKPKQAAELLKSLPADQVEKFCMHTLKSLAYPKDEMGIELQKTLRTYLEHNCSVTDTANAMFLHRNTIKYRIKKCEELLESDFTDSGQCFQLLLSLVLVADK